VSATADADVARVRQRLLEAFWTSGGMGARERRARLDAVLQESVRHLDPQARNRVVEQVLAELARWTPAADDTGGGGEEAREALAAALVRDPPPAGADPDAQRLAAIVRLLVDHLALESQNYVHLLKDVVGGMTVSMPNDFLQVMRDLVRGGAGRDEARDTERLKKVLRDLQVSWNVLFSGSRVAAAQALKRLVDDLDPAAALAGGRRGLEEYERLYEEFASMSAEDLRDRYFTDPYKKEIKKGAGV
jgi:hypothetical protein